MDPSVRLEKLLSCWRQAPHLTPEELCRDCPELVHRLTERIEALQSPGAGGPFTAAWAPEPLSRADVATVDLVPDNSDPNPAADTGKPEELQLPARVGRYLVEDKTGQGVLGAVVRVRDPELQRPLAVKVMLPRAARQAGAEERFREEARFSNVEHRLNLDASFHSRNGLWPGCNALRARY